MYILTNNSNIGNDSELESGDSNDHDDGEDNNEWDVMKSVAEEVLKTKKRGRPVGSKSGIHGTLIAEEEEEEEHECTVKAKKKQRLDVCGLMSLGCCAMLCLSLVSENCLVMVYENMAAYSKTERNQWVLNWLWSHNKWNEGDGSFTFFYSISEWNVCLTAWLSVIGVPLSTYYAIRTRFFNCEKTIPSQGNKEGRTGVATQYAMVWLRDFITKYAQMQPDKCELHLPPCLTKQGIYENMKEELTQLQSPLISEKHFYKMWKKDLPHVKIPKNSRLSKCNICTRIKLHLADVKDKKSRLVLISMRNEHLKKQSLERQKYYKHIQKAKKHPDKYLSIIIDGMDQSKTEIPHYMYVSSMVSCLWKLRVHLAGAIVHGVGIYGFFDYMQYQHGSALTIHVLINILWMLKEKLPATLYMQMDNCGRENKNRYLFAFLGLLVELKVFKKIKVSFLPVGHTHEDIDQVFSRFSHWLTDHSALTLPSLIKGFEKCTTPSPTGIITEDVFNVTEWIAPHISSISGHSKPHAFKFESDENGRAMLFTKAYANDKNWDHCEGTEKYLLKSRPSGQPNIIEPNFEKVDLVKLENDIEKAFKYFKSEDIVWWRQLFLSANSTETAGDLPFRLYEIIEAKQNTNATLPVNLDTPNTEVFDFLEEEEVYAPIILGKKTKTANSPLKVDDFGVFDVPTYAGKWPQIGKVVEFVGDKLKVQWYKGSKTTIWNPCTIPVKGQKGERQPWTELVSKTDVKLSGFQLTASCFLPKHVKDFIDGYDFN
ncbi:uncharacterized protein LOC134690365 [Mytilus trossulus]|uniref:uncharacterized protein LOC134690365 n=1 Tax=Mytilus trossulus TaxID=6551 RepID=UPI0030042CDF